MLIIEINESESLMQDKANDLKFNDEVNNSENQQNSSENNINNLFEICFF